MDLALAYVAGFFDGEGCVGLYTSGDRLHYLKVQLTQNESAESLRLLNQLQASFGGWVSRQITRTGRTKLNWQISSTKAASFLRTLLPHLILKQEQARIAVQWEEGRPKAVRGPRGWFSREQSLNDVHVAQLLKSLKRPQ